MKTRFNSKTSTRLTAIIAVIAIMGAFTGCSATITAETTIDERATSAAERETTEASSDVSTEETTTAEEASSGEATAAPQSETSVDSADNGDASYPEVITSIDDNLFGIDIPYCGVDESDLIECIVNIREGDLIVEGSEYNTLLPAGPADCDVVYIVYSVNFSSVMMEEYADDFVAEGYELDMQEYSAFTGNSPDGYRVVAQTEGTRTTVAIYNYEENPNANVAGLG